MSVTDVSTRPVAEIDLRRSRLSAAFLGYMVEPEYAPEPEGIVVYPSTESSPLSLSMFPAGEADSLQQPDVLVRFGPRGNETLYVIQCKSEANEGGQFQAEREPVSRVSLNDIASFVGRTTSETIWHPREQLSSTGKRQCRALTNWLRSVAEDEPSRPILDIEEAGATSSMPLCHREKATVSVSPGLQRETPPMQVGGLGNVSAGLLLWLESSAEDDGDA